MSIQKTITGTEALLREAKSLLLAGYPKQAIARLRAIACNILAEYPHIEKKEP